MAVRFPTVAILQALPSLTALPVSAQGHFPTVAILQALQFPIALQ